MPKRKHQSKPKGQMTELVRAEVSRGLVLTATSHTKCLQSREGLNVKWRRDQDLCGKSYNNAKTLENWLCEDRAEPESKTQQELSRAMQPIRNNAVKKSFLVVCFIC